VLSALPAVAQGAAEAIYTATRRAEELEALAAAWHVERAAARAQIARERDGRGLAERVALGVALSHLRVIEERVAPGHRVRVQVRVPDAIDLDSVRFAPGDPVRLWAAHPDEPGAVRGVVERREEQTLWIMLDRAVDEHQRGPCIIQRVAGAG
jgi:hypothetical protein